MTLQQIRQRKAARTAEARAIVAKAEAEKRQLTAEESANFATIRADIESLEQDEQRQQFLDDAERRAAGVTVTAGNGGDTIAALESRVSLMRVLQAGVEPRALSGEELEYAQETERRTGPKAQGVLVPMSALWLLRASSSRTRWRAARAGMRPLPQATRCVVLPQPPTSSWRCPPFVPRSRRSRPTWTRSQPRLPCRAKFTTTPSSSYWP